MNFFMKITFPILLVLGFITLPTQSFVTESSLPSKTTFRNVGIQRSPFLSAYDVSLFQSSSDNDESSSSPVIVESGSTEETANPTSTSVSEPVEESSGVPIDVPSPILLGSSMVLGIASTGSVFELSGGSPQYGFILTAAIAALGAPLSIFLFYAAIQKGIKETEEDDERYRRGK